MPADRKPRVALTGAAGKLGRVVLRDLLEHGWSVLALDQVRPSTLREGDDAQFLRIDLTDHGQVLEALAGRTDERPGPFDAVVHLAAVPAPGLLSNSATFRNNSAATWNVFDAARAAGVRNVVWASSETLLGLPFDDADPPYAPLDEEYRVRPESTYSLVKALEEEMAHHFCRWQPELTMTGLRFSNVMHVEDYAAFPSFDADPRLRKWNLWGYVDARDGAQAVRLSLQRTGPGVEVFVIANADTVMSRSSAELMAEVYPDVEVRGELGEHETLLSIAKARRLLGFEPQHSWRDHV
ncbi:NAD-dependent epimerase/dehydratase family protein [Kineococcus sp. SYSU DK005]|uniref:NAD-dependent epimerase/dehydratase family protein n=1 Tax=Kineococcus sp. SYSU DK005 TaxID=3383126 RepID=UPI003D7D73D6